MEIWKDICGFEGYQVSNKGRVVAKSIDRTFSKEYSSICDAAKDLNLNVGNISNVLNGRQKKTGGYYFEYASEEGAH